MSKLYTSIELDKTRRFKFGYREIIELEDMLDAPISSVLNENIKMKTLGYILYVGLKHEDNDITLEKTIELIDEYSNIQEISEIISNGINNSFNSKPKNKLTPIK